MVWIKAHWDQAGTPRGPSRNRERWDGAEMNVARQPAPVRTSANPTATEPLFTCPHESSQDNTAPILERELLPSQRGRQEHIDRGRLDPRVERRHSHEITIEFNRGRRITFDPDGLAGQLLKVGRAVDEPERE